MHGDDVLEATPEGVRCEGVALSELAARFGTPLHVVSERQLRTNVTRWRTALAREWDGPVALMPALKANPLPRLRSILNNEGVGCDVFGPGELEVALRVGVPAKRVSLNGPTKSDTLLERALDAGVLITLDSADEYQRVATMAGSRGTRARIRFRLRPVLPRQATKSDIDPNGRAVHIAAESYRLGMTEQDIAACLAAAVRDPHTEPLGLHAHIGRHTTDLDVWRAYAREIGAACARLVDGCPGWEPRQISLGGGYAAPRDPTGSDGRRLAPGPSEYTAVLASGLKSGLAPLGTTAKQIELQLEPGRALYANAGLHLTTVLHVKDLGRTRFAETDTSEVYLPDTIIERNRWRVVLVNDPDRPVGRGVAITGCSCGFDVLVAEQPQPDLCAGDVLAVLDTGAYQDVASGRFNLLPRPATVLVSDTAVELVRPGETIDDAVASWVSTPASVRFAGRV